ncbi:sphingosine-1-phosphate lyase 1-like [Anneissia japonica]|uniref:sphingosine-1-phosphate lyase 1-like n=1 Tax=Anneissia japonica TaxID=1529436 RepID=UPI0014255AA7|nr:sphingosine-1-phosphate lyase 1-like [Anneissia japonica]
MDFSEILANLEVYWDIFLLNLDDLRKDVNGRCVGVEPWQLISFSIGITLIITWIYQWLNHPELTIMQRVKRTFFTCVKNMPYVKGKVRFEL